MRYLFDGPPTGPVQDIGILLLPEFSNLTLAGMLEPLRAANMLAGQPLYRWRLLSRDGGPVASSSGLSLAVAGGIDAAEALPALTVIASYRVERYTTEALKAGLRRLRAKGCQFGGIESGAYTLAWAGLLDGYRATTHWQDLEDFSGRFPAVKTVPDRFVIDRGRFTTGGAIPALDMMLHLVRRQHGEGLAHTVGSLFIYGQEKLSTDPQRAVSTEILRRKRPQLAAAIALMESHIEAPLPVAAIARRCGLGQRDLERQFARFLGTTPRDYYLGLRLGHGQRLLSQTDCTVLEAAVASGFTSASGFTRAFRTRFQMRPSEVARR